MTQYPPGPRPTKAIPWGIAAMPAYTFGLLTPVPFLFAAVKLQIRKLWLIVAAYGAAWIAILVVGGVTPEHSAVNTLLGFLFVGLAVAATTHAFLLRRSMSPNLRTQQVEPPVAALVSDPSRALCAQLQAALSSLRHLVATQAGLFPPTFTQLLNETIAPMEQVVRYAARGGHADAELSSVQAILIDYLPTSVGTYLRLPREYALSQRNPDGRTPADELELQLRLLRDSAKEAAGSLYRGDALRLEEQSAFLQSKFGKSELDLP